MSLTEEDKKRIEEEEKYRAEVRQGHTEHAKPAKKGMGCGTIMLIMIIAFFVITGFILQGTSKNGSTNTETTPTPIADQKWIDDAGQRYYDNHSSMSGFKEQFTLDKSKKLMEMCIATLKSKGECEEVVDKKFWIGMSSDWATFSVGTPNKINKTVMSGLEEEQWVYGNPLYQATYLYFYNGVLKSYQQ